MHGLATLAPSCPSTGVLSNGKGYRRLTACVTRVSPVCHPSVLVVIISRPGQRAAHTKPCNLYTPNPRIPKPRAWDKLARIPDPVKEPRKMPVAEVELTDRWVWLAVPTSAHHLPTWLWREGTEGGAAACTILSPSEPRSFYLRVRDRLASAKHATKATHAFSCSAHGLLLSPLCLQVCWRPP